MKYKQEESNDLKQLTGELTSDRDSLNAVKGGKRNSDRSVSRKWFTSRGKVSFTSLLAAHRSQIERNTRRPVYQHQDLCSNRVKVLGMNCGTQRRTVPLR